MGILKNYREKRKEQRKIEILRAAEDIIFEKDFKSLNSGYETETNITDTATAQDFLLTYEKYIWVSVAINAIAKAVSGLPIKINMLNGDDTLGDEVYTGQAYDLIYKPNPFQSKSELIEALVCYLELTGAAYMEKSNPESPNGLRVLRSDYVEPIFSRTDLVGGFKYNPMCGSSVYFAPKDIVWIKNFHPRSELSGLSAVSPAQQSVIIDLYAMAYEKNFFVNGGIINQYVSVKRQLGEGEFKRLKERLRSEYSGVTRSHLPMILDDEGELKGGGASPKDSLIITQRQELRNQVLSAMGVPPIMCNLLAGNETYNNASTQIKAFWENRGIPLVNKIQDKLNRDVFWDLRYEITFDIAGIKALQDDQKVKADTARTLVDGKIMTPNEVREKFYQLEPYEGGDTFPQAAQPMFASEKHVHKAAGNKRLVAVQKKIDVAEEKIFEATKAIFKRYERLVVANVKGSGSVQKSLLNDAFKGLSDIEKEMIDDLNDVESEAVIQNIESEYKRIKKQPIPGATLAAVKKQISKNVEKWARESGDSIINTMQDRIKTYLKVAQEEQHNIRTMTENIQKIFRGKDLERAEFPHARMIARTEGLKSVNYGNYVAMQESGIKKIEWIASGLPNDRPEHTALDGTQVEFGDAFPGVGLKYPGDPSGSVDQLVNCRCAYTEVE